MKHREKPTAAGAANELLQELALLRSRVDESAEQFSLGVKARIDEIERVLASGSQPDAGHVLPEPRLLEKMVRHVRLLVNRPARGRAKELKKIQDLIALLSDALVTRE